MEAQNVALWKLSSAAENLKTLDFEAPKRNIVVIVKPNPMTKTHMEKFKVTPFQTNDVKKAQIWDPSTPFGDTLHNCCMFSSLSRSRHKVGHHGHLHFSSVCSNCDLRTGTSICSLTMPNCNCFQSHFWHACNANWHSSNVPKQCMSCTSDFSSMPLVISLKIDPSKKLIPDTRRGSNRNEIKKSKKKTCIFHGDVSTSMFFNVHWMEEICTCAIAILTVISMFALFQQLFFSACGNTMCTCVFHTRFLLFWRCSTWHCLSMVDNDTDSDDSKVDVMLWWLFWVPQMCETVFWSMNSISHWRCEMSKFNFQCEEIVTKSSTKLCITHFN